MKYCLNGNDWCVSGWMRHQWKYQKLMETETFSLPAVLSVPATVPGSVQSDLLSAGIIDDWNYGDSFLKMEWIEHREWVYEKHFAIDGISAQRYELIFEGLDYFGYIFLNGREIAFFEGMHLTHTVDVTDVLKNGDNHLRVVFLQPPEVEGQIGYTSKVKTLKSRYNYGWDWMPRMVNIGIFGDVYLKAINGAVIRDAYPCAYFNGCTPTLTDTVKIERFDFRQLSLHVTLTELDGTPIVSTEMPVTRSEMSVTLDAIGVRSWQVNGFGEQPLYRVHTSLWDENGIVDEACHTVGFRTLTYDRPVGASSDALPYVPVVNGIRIPIRGVNWVPLSPFYGTVTKEEYRCRLTTLRDMNVTLIRVWGGALLESEAFYDICDELGILVWQEFPQSSSGIENEACADTDFIDALLNVARTYIYRRRARASLAFWCGGNELYYDDYRPQGLEHPTLRALCDVVKELDGDRLFLPASPSGPVPGNNEYIGTGKLHDTHGPWNYAAGPKDYYTEFNRNDSLLHSEIGAPSATRLELLEKYKEGNELWPPDKTNRYWLTRGAWWLQLEQMTEWFGEFGGKTRDIDAYVRAFRFVQAEALRYAVSSVRYADDKKAGVIIWMGNEPFPNTANTSLLEFDGCPKPAYYAVKEMFAPCVLALRHNGIVARAGKVRVTPFFRVDKSTSFEGVGDAEILVYDMSGKLLEAHKLPRTFVDHDWDPIDVTVTAPVLVRFCSKALKICVEYVFVTDSEHPFSALLELSCTDISTEYRNDSVVIKNRSDSTALYCDVTLKGADGSVIAAKNGNLCLLPGEMRAVYATSPSYCDIKPLNGASKRV